MAEALKFIKFLYQFDNGKCKRMITGNFFNCSKDYGNMTAAEIKKYNRIIKKLLSVHKKRKRSIKKQSKKKRSKKKQSKRKEKPKDYHKVGVMQSGSVKSTADMRSFGRKKQRVKPRLPKRKRYRKRKKEKEGKEKRE